MTENEFNIIRAILSNKANLISGSKLGITEVDLEGTLLTLKEKGLIANDNLVTELGHKAMEAYKVDSAIIMAAGISSRCLPFSKIIPKGLFEVKGEILLERQIRQLQECGLDKIILVVGYMKEKFYYLKDKFDILIIENNDFIERNNNHSLFLAQKYLKNSYICCSDIYYPQNVFSQYEYSSYFACKYSDKFIDEYCIAGMKNNYITKIEHGGKNCWYTMGHVYFNTAISERFIELLNIEHDYPEVKKMIFDDFHNKHIDKLPAGIKEYANDDILEFDTLEEVIGFDGDFRRFIIDRAVNDWIGEYSDIKRYSTIPTEQKTGRLHLNENLYLPSPKCLDVLKNISLEDLAIYDAGGNDILEMELEKAMSIPIQNIFIHNGSSDVIKTILNLTLKMGNIVLIPNLSWNYYKAVITLKFASCVSYNIKENNNSFYHDIDDILFKSKEYNPKVIIITTPNNPTGNSISENDLEKIISENPHSLVLVDEAYEGFSDVCYNYKNFLDKYKNVVFTKTFSKFYALAGVRIGFGICTEFVKEIIDLDLPVFRTSVISRKLAVTAIQDLNYYCNIKQEIIETRGWFIDEINKMREFKAFHSNANFVFVKALHYDVKEMKSQLEKNGILVRLVAENSCMGLRITIGPRAVMQKVLDIMHINTI